MMRIYPETIRLAGVAVLALLMLLAAGCTQTSVRTISATHWGVEQTNSAAETQRVVQAPAEEAAARDDEVADSEGLDAELDEETGEAAELAQPAPAPPVAPAGAANDDEMTLYVAYIETVSTQTPISDDDESALVRSLMRFCTLKADNSLDCRENEELNRMLNPHLH